MSIVCAQTEWLRAETIVFLYICFMYCKQVEKIVQVFHLTVWSYLCRTECVLNLMSGRIIYCYIVWIDLQLDRILYCLLTYYANEI